MGCLSGEEQIKLQREEALSGTFFQPHEKKMLIISIFSDPFDTLPPRMLGSVQTHMGIRGGREFEFNDAVPLC